MTHGLNDQRPEPERLPAGSIFMGVFVMLVLLSGQYALMLLLMPRLELGGLEPLVQGACFLPLVGTTFYGLARYMVALRYWRPDMRGSLSRVNVLRAWLNCAAVVFAVSLPGPVLGVAVMRGASRESWEWPAVVAGLACAHLAWRWADPRAAHLSRWLLAGDTGVA